MAVLLRKPIIYYIIDILLLLCFITLSLCKDSVALLIFSVLYFTYLTILTAKITNENKVYFIARSIFIMTSIAVILNFKYIAVFNDANLLNFAINISLLIFIIFCFAYRKDLKSKVVILLVIAVMNVFFIGNIMITASKVWAFNPVSSGVGEITDKLYSRNLFGEPGSYSLEVKISEKKKTGVNIVVDKNYFYKCEIGDTVNYTVINGLFGEKYVELKNN